MLLLMRLPKGEHGMLLLILLMHLPKGEHGMLLLIFFIKGEHGSFSVILFYGYRVRYIPGRFRRFSDRFLLDPVKIRFVYDIRNRLEKHVSGYGGFPAWNTASEIPFFSGRFLREYVRILQERRRKGTVSCGFRPETDAGTIVMGTLDAWT